jgi:hypothetical protein
MLKAKDDSVKVGKIPCNLHIMLLPGQAAPQHGRLFLQNLCNYIEQAVDMYWSVKDRRPLMV